MRRDIRVQIYNKRKMIFVNIKIIASSCSELNLGNFVLNYCRPLKVYTLPVLYSAAARKPWSSNSSQILDFEQIWGSNKCTIGTSTIWKTPPIPLFSYLSISNLRHSTISIARDNLHKNMFSRAERVKHIFHSSKFTFGIILNALEILRSDDLTPL